MGKKSRARHQQPGIKPALDAVAFALNPEWKRDEEHAYKPMLLAGQVQDLMDQINDLKKEKRRWDQDESKLRQSRRDMLAKNQELRNKLAEATQEIVARDVQIGELLITVDELKKQIATGARDGATE